MEAAYRHPWRPARYWIAGLIGAGVLLVIIASSVLAILFQEVPARGTIFGLPAVALVVAATVLGARALHDHELATRTRDLVRAGVLLGIGLLLWLLVVDVFTFTQAAGPGVAAVCALACAPTLTVGGRDDQSTLAAKGWSGGKVVTGEPWILFVDGLYAYTPSIRTRSPVACPGGATRRKNRNPKARIRTATMPSPSMVR